MASHPVTWSGYTRGALTCLETASWRDHLLLMHSPPFAEVQTFIKKVNALFSLGCEGPVFPLRRGSEAASSAGGGLFIWAEFVHQKR